MADLWSKAAESLKKDEKKSFEFQISDRRQLLQDIIGEVEQQCKRCLNRRWKIKSFNGREIIVRDVCAKIVTWVNRFAQVGDAAIQWDPGHAALPWAAFRLLLRLCTDDLQAFESIVEGLEKTSGIISRGTIIERLYVTSTEHSEGQKLLENALVKLYTSVLVYLTSASKYFAASSGKRFIKSTFRYSETSAVLSRINEQEAEVGKFSRLLDAQRQKDIHSLIPGLKIDLDTLGQSFNNLLASQTEWKRLLSLPYSRIVPESSCLLFDLPATKKNDVLRWLSLIPVHKHHENFVKDIIPGTGQWLLSCPQYTKWKSASSSEVFWLRGIPGCGKTRLAARVIEDLRQDQQNTTNPAPVAYFYCSRDPAELERSDPAQILRALIKQLSQVTPDGPMFKQTQQVYEEKAADANAHNLQLSTLELAESAKLLHDLANSSPLTIIIDGVDESALDRRHLLFKALQNLITNSVNVVKIFLTSREDDDIKISLKGSQGIRIANEDNFSNIENFIRLRVHEAVQEGRLMPGVDPSQFEVQVYNILIEKTQSMFQWASLQIVALCDRRRIKVLGDLFSTLRSAPQTLVESYQNMYCQIKALEKDSRLIATKTLTWLLHAQRPLSTLEWLAIFRSDRNLIGPSWVEDLTIDTILDCCCTLVTLDEQMDVLRFSHQSVRELFESHVEFEAHRSHLALAQRCLDTYILAPASHSQNDLASYASAYWGSHCQKAANRNPLKQQLLEFLYKREHFQDFLDDLTESLKEFDDTSQYYKKLQALLAEPATPLFAIACFGLKEALDDEDVEALDFAQVNAHGASSLYLAARWGHTDVVEYFLDQGIDVDTAGGHFGSALQAASFAGHLEIVRLLLSRKASISKPGRFSNAIEAAIAGRHEQIDKVILESSSKDSDTFGIGEVLKLALFDGNITIIKSMAKYGYLEAGLTEVPLQTTLSRGKEREARRLLTTVQDINSLEGVYGNALQAAVFGRSLSLVQMIVNAGAQVDHLGRFGTALRAASMTGQVDVVRWLLGRGVNCNNEDKELGDCLQVASSKGHTEIMQLLLDHRADIDGSYGYFGSTTQAAAFYGQTTAISLLMREGASIELPGRFPNALHAAIYGNQPEMIQLLLTHGADPGPRRLGKMKPCSVNRNPRKPLPNFGDLEFDGAIPQFTGALSVAAMLGSISSIKMLLANDASINAAPGDFSALQIASFKGSQEAVLYLLDHGADVNAVHKTLGSALHAAVASANFEIAKMLLRRGAKVDIHWRKFGSPFQVVCERGDLVAARFLLEMGADINDTGGKNGSALQVAAGAGHHEIVSFLIENGADINCTNGDLGPALHAASTKGYSKVIDALLDHDADIELMGDRRAPALSVAAQSGQHDAVRILLHRGAEINAHHPEMPPALHLASLEGHISTVQTLLDYGANAYVKAQFPELTQGTMAQFNYWEESMTALHVACLKGHAKVAQMILSHEPRAFADYTSFTETVMVAIDLIDSEKSDELCDLPRALIQSGLDHGLHIEQFNVAMLLASRRGLQYLVKYFLQKGMDPNILGILNKGEMYTIYLHLSDRPANRLLRGHRSNEQQTPLHAAVLHGRKETVRLLLNAGADIERPSGTGVSPLDAAIFGTACQRIGADDHLGTIRILLEAGARIEHSDTKSLEMLRDKVTEACDLELASLIETKLPADQACYIPKHDALMASAVGKSRLNTIQALLEADPTKHVDRAALKSYLSTAIRSGSLDLSAFLISRFPEAKTIIRDPECDLLIEASQKGHLKLVDLLLQESPNLSPKILSQALEKNMNKDVIQSILNYIHERNLVENGTIDLGEILGRCLARAIITDQQHDLPNFLVNHGANVNYRDKDLGTPLYVASRWESRDLRDSNESLVASLLECGADPNITGSEYGTPLIAAVIRDQREKVRILLSGGADPNIHGDFPGTALIAAAASLSTIIRAERCYYFERGSDERKESSSPSILEMLLQHGAAVNTVPVDIGEWGSALQAACYYNHKRPIKILLDRGANVNAKGGVLGSPLMAAVYQGHKEVVEMLIERGADVNATGGFYGSVWKSVRRSGTGANKALAKDIEDILLRAGATERVGEVTEGGEMPQVWDKLPHWY